MPGDKNNFFYYFRESLIFIFNPKNEIGDLGPLVYDTVSRWTNEYTKAIKAQRITRTDDRLKPRLLITDSPTRQDASIESKTGDKTT